MRITFLLTQSLESPSGLGRYWPLAKEMVRLGHQVIIMALHHDYQPLQRRHFTQEGVEVLYVGQMHVRKRGIHKTHLSPIRLIWTSALATWGLMRNALGMPVDALHVGKPHPMNGMAGYLAAKRHRVPLYVDCDDYEAASQRYSGRWQRPVVRWFEDWLPRRATGVTTNTRFTERRLQGLGVSSDRIMYVPNGVDVARFTTEGGEEPTAMRRRLGLADRPVILYLGNLSLASHPVDLLIDAFATVHATSPQAVLLLVGGGDDVAVLQSQVERLGLKDAVQFVGRVPPGDVPSYYRLADVSVDPVHDDPVARARSPLKVVESMLAGTPVVTGDVGDRRHVLADGKAGLLVEPGSADALAEAMLWVITTPDLAHELAQAAREGAELYRWDHLVRDFVRVYEI